MSYAYNKRKKLIKRLKKQFGPVEWHREYENILEELRRQREGPGIPLTHVLMPRGTKK